MLRVVLADDEPSVLEGLRLFVDWNALGLTVVGEALDGTSAFTVIQKELPDLVICDIRMPGLSGLELIEKVTTAGKGIPKFLILSGYTDFTYAQKGLQLGALGYVTKPLDRQELTREIGRAATIIRSENAAKLDSLELIRYTANQLYNDIMDGKSGERFERKARLLFEVAGHTPLRLVQLMVHTCATADNIPDNEICTLLMRLAGIHHENSVFYNGAGSYVAVVHEGIQPLAGDSRFTEELILRIHSPDPLLQSLRACWALISEPQTEGTIVQRIHACGLQLEQLQAYCMLHPETVVLDYEKLRNDLLCEQPDGQMLLPAGLPFAEIVGSLSGDSAQDVTRAVDDFFDVLARHRVSHRLYAICLYRLADIVKRRAYAYAVEAADAVRRFTETVGNKDPGCRLLAHTMCRLIYEKQRENDNKPMALLESEVVDYIKENCTTGLSLQGIAEHFSLSAIIISKIVRKKTGQKFNDYINYLRIEYAKALIASENKKIAVVCEEAGYSDYSYFIEKFKAFTGLSPSEYKKRYL